MNGNVVLQIPDDNPFRHDLAKYEAEARTLMPSDEVTEQGALLFLGKCKESEKALDEERRAKTDPLRTEIDAITKPYKLAIEGFAELRRLIQQRLDAYHTKKAEAVAEQQRQAIADANRKRAEEEEKARIARVAADQARAAGNETAAVKLESKAERAELKASTVTPDIIAQPKKTVDLVDGGKATYREEKDWLLMGRNKDTETLYADDRLFDQLDWSRYRRLFVLDKVRVNRAVKAGEQLPAPFQIVTRKTVVNRKG